MTVLRPHHLIAPALVTLGLIGACTNDFSQFEPDGSDATTTTTTSTSTTGGAGGAGGAGSTTTTTTSMGSEDCTDGIDNDMDGAIDCADTEDCGGYTCVPLPPGGNWEGPGILYAGDAAAVPDCPADFPTMVYDGIGDPVQEDATCAACACSTPTVDCTLGQITAYNNANCTGGNSSHAQPPVNTCGQINPGSGTDSYRAPEPAINASACTASGGQATVPPPVAGATARVCGPAATAGGCATNGQSCIPTMVGAPFESAVCVWRDGDHACPNDFTVRHYFGESLNDTRGCEPCTCGAAQATCNAVTLVYSDTNCMNLLEMVPNNMTCVAATVGQSVMTMWDPMGTCPASGGQPTGSVDLGGATMTVCCMP